MMRFGRNLKEVVNYISLGDRHRLKFLFCVSSLHSILYSMSKYLTFLIPTSSQDILSCKSSKGFKLEILIVSFFIPTRHGDDL